MSEQRTYKVYFHPQSLDVLGEALKPFLVESAEGQHLLCKEIDTTGAFCELTLAGSDSKGQPLDVEVIIPSGMIRLVISASVNDVDFGFG